MKRIGIVGGIAWPSTVDYYSEICRRAERLHIVNRSTGLASMPEIVIESLDLGKAVSYLGVDCDGASWSRFDGYHRAALRRLQASGADFALIASNTAHCRLEEITREITIPVLDMFRLAAEASAESRIREVLILGTSATMRSLRFRNEFAIHDIHAEGPADVEAQSMIAELISELQHGEVDDGAERVAIIVRRSSGQFQRPPVVCLACTELSLAFPPQRSRPTFDADGFRYVNPTMIHIEAAVEFATADEANECRD